MWNYLLSPITVEWCQSLSGLLTGCDRAEDALEGCLTNRWVGPGECGDKAHGVNKIGGECWCSILKVSGHLGWKRKEKCHLPTLLFLEKSEDPCPSSANSENSLSSPSCICHALFKLLCLCRVSGQGIYCDCSLKWGLHFLLPSVCPRVQLDDFLKHMALSPVDFKSS